MEENKQYRWLQDIFENWYFKKSKEIGIKENIEKIPKNMLKRLGLTKEEFNKIYIKPYMSLSKHDLNITLDVLRAKLIETHAHKTNPVHYEFKLDIDKERKNNALTWLIFHISLLHIFELPNSITRNVITPYEQCYYCGKPNFYRKNNKTIKFNKKEIFCHKDLCKKGTNTKDHDNCCYELWHTKRKKIQRTLDSLIDRYSEIEAKVRAIESFSEIKEITPSKNVIRYSIKTPLQFQKQSFLRLFRLNYIGSSLFTFLKKIRVNVNETTSAIIKLHHTLLTLPVCAKSHATGIRMTSCLPSETNRE